MDTNLLLLYLVGAYDRRLVSRFKRTADRFEPEDFDTLARLLGQFDVIVTTPYVLTEASNFLGQLSGRVKEECFTLFARSISKMSEKHTLATNLSRSPAFIKFGLTDVSIHEAAKDYLVLTDDFPLAGYLGRQGVDVLNFNNIRLLGY